MSQLDSQRFVQVWRRLGGQGDGEALFRALATAYAEPQRAYHTVAHLQDCLKQFDNVRASAAQPDQLEMALWFHDAVYDPRAADNEAQSAAWAMQALTKNGIAFTVVEQIAGLVLATKHQQIPNEPDAQLIVDIDLTILGSAPVSFAEYAQQIRLEYQWVASEEYRVRRIQVLNSFLARATIYQTPYFYTRYEQQARQNLRQAIEQLAQQVA